MTVLPDGSARRSGSRVSPSAEQDTVHGGLPCRTILTLDALIRTYGMDVAEPEDLLLWVRVLYRGGHAIERQARSLDDMAIDSRP